MSKPLKIWNGRGDQVEYDHYYVCAATKKEAATMIAIYENPSLAQRPDISFHINRTLREMGTYYAEGCWGSRMNGITPERGLWATRKGESWESKPVRLV